MFSMIATIIGAVGFGFVGLLPQPGGVGRWRSSISGGAEVLTGVRTPSTCLDLGCGLSVRSVPATGSISSG
jgi:hypothetical protein